MSLQFVVNDTPMPLIGWEAAATLWNFERTTKYADFAVTFVDRALGRIDLFLTKEQTVWLPDMVYGDLYLTDPYDISQYYAEFVITVSEGYST